MPYYLEAEYQDGFVLREDEQDHSPYDAGRNIFHAILNKRAEAVHGPMVRFSLVGPETTYSIDWTLLPDNARPIRFKQMEHERNVATGETDIRCTGIDFGYQYTDTNGQNVQEVRRVS